MFWILVLFCWRASSHDSFREELQWLLSKPMHLWGVLFLHLTRVGCTSSSDASGHTSSPSLPGPPARQCIVLSPRCQHPVMWGLAQGDEVKGPDNLPCSSVGSQTSSCCLPWTASLPAPPVPAPWAGSITIFFNSSPPTHVILWFSSPVWSHILSPFRNLCSLSPFNFTSFFICWHWNREFINGFERDTRRLKGLEVRRCSTFFQLYEAWLTALSWFPVNARMGLFVARISSVGTRDIGHSICSYLDTHLELEIFCDLKMLLKESKHKQTYKSQIFILPLKNKAILSKHCIYPATVPHLTLCWVLMLEEELGPSCHSKRRARERMEETRMR